MAKFQFRRGTEVKVGRGTTRFPVAKRYQGRFGVVETRKRVGNTVVYGINMGARRESLLFVTQGNLSTD
jgi:hypothetical protein